MKSNDKYQYIPLGLVMGEPDEEGSYYLLKDRWWAVKEDHIVFCYYTNPQCNKIRSIAERMNGEVKFINKVFIPLDYDGVYDIKDLMA